MHALYTKDYRIIGHTFSALRIATNSRFVEKSFRWKSCNITHCHSFGLPTFPISFVLFFRMASFSNCRVFPQ
jgi:hypothetical protein